MRHWLQSVGISLLLLTLLHHAKAQQKGLPRPSQNTDTVRMVQIIDAKKFDFKTIDSVTQLQIFTSNVIIRQGATLFKADSVVYNEAINFMEAYGNVHINDADSINIYSQFMQYDGAKKLAIFKNKVKLTDGNSTLYTDQMEYDMNGKVGTYRDGGRIESKQTTLVSKQGFYYADIKDVYFIGNVKMSDPEVALASDSLLYNTSNEVATFIAPTTIKTKSSVVNTREGYYDLKFKKARFGKRARMQDSTSVMIADDFAFDDKTGFGEAKGNIQYKDTAQGLLLFSNRVFFNKTSKNFLATEKPVMVVVQEQDSIYIAADTIYSGLMKDLTQARKGYINQFDTSSNKIKTDSLAQKDTIRLKDLVAEVDSTRSPTKPIPAKDSMVVAAVDTTRSPANPIPIRDSMTVAAADTNKTPAGFKGKQGQDTLRFITAFRHVRIFNDSLQAVCDSLFYSGVDSVFELYREPVAWSKGSQITGDTIFIYTSNKKPSRLYVYENAMMIQAVKEEAVFFNQLRGRTINGYFTDGELRHVNAKGTAESIYFAQDDDSAFVGMNRTTADMIDMYILNRTAQKVKFTSSVKGITYPIRQLPSEEKKIPGFIWLEEKRPKTKLELFL